jgi:hypothetical protein
MLYLGKLINWVGTLLLSACILFGLMYGANFVFDEMTAKYDGYCARVDAKALLCLYRDDAISATLHQ